MEARTLVDWEATPRNKKRADAWSERYWRVQYGVSGAAPVSRLAARHLVDRVPNEHGTEG